MVKKIKMSVSYLLKYIFYVFIIFCLVSHRFPVGIRVLNGGGVGSPGPEFARLFHDNPACRTPVISNPKTIFFPNSASCAKILANPASRVTVNSRIPSINFAFSRIPNPGSNPGYRETSFRLYRISLASIFVAFMRMTRPVP